MHINRPKQGELENLIGKNGTGTIFTELKLRGINLCPTDEDASNCFQEGSAEALLVIKNQDLETKAPNDISTVAGAFAIEVVYGIKNVVVQNVFSVYWRKLVHLMMVVVKSLHVDRKMVMKGTTRRGRLEDCII